MKSSLGPSRLLGAIGLLCCGITAPAQAVNISVKITVDNSYALFYGTNTAATTFVGSDFYWPSVETYNFNLPANHYLYVVTASDLSVAQGFLGQFENLDDNYKFYSNDPQWQVMATGLGSNAPYTGSAADLALLTQEIIDANGGGNASNGWVATVQGPNNGSGVWGGPLGGIDTEARWVWHSANGDPDPTSPGFDHDEWLVFRIALAASPNDPNPDPTCRSPELFPTCRSPELFRSTPSRSVSSRRCVAGANRRWAR
jgi:hypothetical protein